jgi:hypothetical protein
MSSRRLRQRAVAPDPAPLPSLPASTSALALLHPELQRHIGSFLSASDAAPGVASASRACRLDFLAGVTHATITDKPLQLEPGKPEEEHAASLARLLRCLASLSIVQLPSGAVADSNSDALIRIMGLACRRLDAPLAKLVSVGTHYFCIGRDEPHPLAQALAEGRLPALQQLDTRDWSFLRQPSNAALLEQALVGGHLTRLELLDFSVGPALDALCCGLLQAPPSIQQRQAVVRVLDISDYGNHTMDIENLEAALRLPCFARLEETKLWMGTEEAQEHMLRVLARYIQHVGGAPSLSSLVLSFAAGTVAGVGPLVQALGAGGGAPNLETLTLVYAKRQSFEDLGAIYAAGGLSRLRKLFLHDPSLGAGAAALLEAVGATPHRGAALKRIFFGYRYNQERHTAAAEIEAFKEQLQAAQQRGIFPNVRVTDNIPKDPGTDD